MPCYSKYQEGGNLIICGRLGPHCNDSRCNWVADYLCDYPVGNGKTCDRSLCADHAYEIAPGIHYCASHYNAWVDFKNAGGVKRELENVVPYKKV